MIYRVHSLLILLVFGSIFSCTTESKPENTVSLEKYPILIDEKHDLGTPVEKEWLSYANYDLYYIGPKRDSLVVDHLLSAKFHRDYLDSENDSLPPAEYGQYDNSWENLSESSVPAEFSTLKIEVDTNQYIAGNQKTYAVFITNVGLDTTLIAYRSRIPAIMEAKNENGKWLPIQEALRGCGFEVHSVKLPPNEMVLTSAPVFKGESKTKLRIRIGKNYSNTFYGSINYTQFQSQFKANGDAK